MRKVMYLSFIKRNFVCVASDLIMKGDQIPLCLIGFLPICDQESGQSIPVKWDGVWDTPPVRPLLGSYLDVLCFFESP